MTLGSAAAAVVGLAGLLGYLTGTWFLGAIRADFIPMAPSTAIGFLILSAVLFRQTRGPWRGVELMAAAALAALVAVFGLLVVLPSVAGIDLGIEDRLFPGAGTLGAIPVGRMSPATGITFVLAGLGTCLLLLRPGSPRHAPSLGHGAATLGVATVLAGATVLLAYLYGAPLMYGGTTIPMAATTAVAFLFIGTTLVAAAGPTSFPIRHVTGDATSAVLSRAFLPLALVALLVPSPLMPRQSALWVTHPLTTAVLAAAVGVAAVALIARVANVMGRRLDASNRKVRDSQELLSLFVRRSPIYTFIKSVTPTESRVVQVSDNFQQMVGIAGPEMVGRTMAEMFPPELAARMTADDWSVVSGGEVLTVDEELNGRSYTSIKYPIRQGDATLLAGYTLDITERQRAEAALRESEERHRLLFEHMQEGFSLNEIITDENGTAVDFRILDANAAYEYHTGLKPGEVIGRTILEIMPQADRRQIETYGAVALTGEPKVFEYFSRTFGRHLRVRVFRPQPRRFATIFEDITARKRAEEVNDALQAQVLELQKLESVGRLAGGVAHDFNNSLQLILLNVEMALRAPGLTPDSRQLLEDVQRTAQHSARLIAQLMAFARRQPTHPRALDLNDVTSSYLPMLRRLVGEDVVVKWEPRAGLWPVWLDPAQYEQVLVNLATNARDAMRGNGQLTLEISCETIAAADATPADVPPGDYVRLSVSDDGCGMSEEVRAHAFEPFYTTKPVGEGTGLGLASVYGIVSQNGGSIAVDSAPSRGATFTIHWPRRESAEPLPSGEPATPTARSGGETVLLVEDEPMLLRAFAACLEPLGYTVLAAALPGEALRVAEAHDGPIHLLVTDVIMPEMNGRELADRLAVARPELRRLYVSGYAANVLSERGLADGTVRLLHKPFPLEDLARAVREALDEA